MRKFFGVVRSISGNKTISVQLERRCVHERYKKIVVRKKSYAVHDERNFYKLGDSVHFVLCRPISRTKTYCALYEE